MRSCWDALGCAGTASLVRFATEIEVGARSQLQQLLQMRCAGAQRKKVEGSFDGRTPHTLAPRVNIISTLATRYSPVDPILSGIRV